MTQAIPSDPATPPAPGRPGSSAMSGESGPPIGPQAGGGPRPWVAPEVRSVPEALGPVRRYIDALLMAALGVFGIVYCANTPYTSPGLALGAVAILGYSLYIGLTKRGYVMPYSVYAVATLAVLVLVVGTS